MDNIVKIAIFRYFNTLKKLGYFKYSEVYKLLYVIAINEAIKRDINKHLTHEDMKLIDSSLRCIIGTSCLFPYPNRCNK